MDSNSTNDVSPNPYQYRSLPNARSIRLIKFNPVHPSGGGIEISLLTDALDEAPPFIALSYTWGNPTSSFSEQAPIAEIVYESKGEIKVEGHVFSVKYNLLDALELLSRLPSAKTGQYFWIDAICINQQDPNECGAQVSIMNEIYGTAIRVLVWLGQEDEFLEDAMSLIKSIGSVPVERHSEVTVGDWFNQQAVFRRLGLHQAPKINHWLGIIAFLQRPFFSRIWIVQEVILAKDVVVACGNTTFAWNLISNTVSFITTSGWQMYLTSGYFRGARQPIPGMSSSVNSLSIYHNMIQQHGVEIIASAIYLETTRRGIEQSGHLVVFRHLLEIFRHSRASDPRDMIYALLSLAWKEVPPFSSHPGLLIPDYEISVGDLFIKTARVMLEGTNDLRYLCHVEDRSQRKLHDLPSWVPDYTAYLRPSPFYLQRFPGPDMYHNAGKGLEKFQDPGGLTSDQLLVSGFRLSRIVSLVDPFPMSEWVEEGITTNENWFHIFQFAAQIGDVQMKTIDPSVGRCEVLWRSLCGNHVKRQYPAPEGMNSIFFHWLCIWCVARTFVWEENQSHLGQVHEPDQGRSKQWERLMKLICQLFDREPAASEFQISAFEDLFGQSIVGATHWREFEWFRPVFNDWWQDVNAHSTNRRHLQDDNQRFCIGPLCCKKGDEIWILSGGKDPYLLREVSDGKYILLGAVYIHGIMDGELADNGLLQDAAQITLV